QTVYADMKLSGTRSTPDHGRVQDRLVFAMVNEAARVLEEQVVGSAADVDLGMVMGTGFPPFRGGLLKYADDRWPAEVLRSLEVLEVTYGHRFAPSPLVRELGESGETFHGAFPAGRE
ncbi:MAG: 3-hydroxyacyl-CoA dehydrogenase family protein, partial [Gemmatimonadota bacterium]|nr:3-hydroxyacyl-CoA dehydrogenase family protein [Gemmatimonadota bacterium]